MTVFSRLCIATAAALIPFTLIAQDTKKSDTPKTDPAPLTVPAAGEEKPNAETPAAKPVDPVVEWKRLAARKLEIFNTLQEMKKTFAAAKDNDAKRKIRAEFTELLVEFESEIHPEMLELADAVWAADPSLLDAGEIALRNAYNANQFPQVADIAAKLLAGQRRTREVYQMAGRAEFALHNFEKAARMVEELIVIHKPTEPGEEEYYKTYIDALRKYTSYWEQEKALRDKEDALEGDAALPRVKLTTNKGEIVVELFEDDAKNTVDNFIQTVEEKKYDGVKFHRVLSAFMAQTGDITRNDEDPLNDGLGPGFTIDCECYNGKARRHFQGSLSMALPQDGKDKGSTQFFITHMPTYWLNYEEGKTESNHTVFGRVIDGMDVVLAITQGDAIETVEVIRKRPHEYKAVRKMDQPDGTLNPKKEDDKKEPAGTEKPAKTEKTQPVGTDK